MTAIRQTRDPKAILMGFGMFGLASVAVTLGVFQLVTLKISRITLPTWSMYALALILTAIGALLIFFSDQQQCKACKKAMESEEAYFPLEAMDRVARAVTEMNAEYLSGMNPVPKNQMKSVVELTYCPSCENVGLIAASKWENYQPHDVIPEREVSGTELRPFVSMVRSHARFRGEDDED